MQLVTRKWLTNWGTIGRFSREVLIIVLYIYPYSEYETRAIYAVYLSYVYSVLELSGLQLKDKAKVKVSLLYYMAVYFIFKGK